MLSFHSIAPVRLTQATEKRPPPKPKPPTAMTDSSHLASHSAVPGGIDADGSAHVKDLKTEREPGAVVPEGQRDSGIDLSHDEAPQDAAEDHERRTASTLNPLEETSHAMSDAQEGHHEASQPVFPSQGVTATANDDTEAGPSRPRPSDNNTPPEDDALIRPVPRRGESTVNAVGYRRDSETVIAFLVPLPKPTIQGSTLDIPPRYFLYVPPPPPLVKPKKGKEPYGIKVRRAWQQNVRKAKVNAHNGKRVSLSALHSATIRGCIWASERRKGSDDGAIFLSRIKPETVAHLVMIHPWALSTDQTPEEILKTFRAQITANKASSMVKILTRKMGPEPKTLQISPKAIIEDTHRPRGSESSEEEDVVIGVTETEQPQTSRRDKVRASFDSAKLRNSVAAIKSQIHQRGRKRHRDGSPSAASPDTAENAEPEANFTGGELEHYSEEEVPEGEGLVDAEGEPFTGHQLGGIPEEGFLDHFEETVEQSPEAAPVAADQAGGGLFAGSSDGANGAGQNAQGAEHAKKGSRFQLTFYPSPAMDIMSRYVQESCHVANGHAFPSPTAAPTTAGVLASIGWEPERRVFADADEQVEDENVSKISNVGLGIKECRERVSPLTFSKTVASLRDRRGSLGHYCKGSQVLGKAMPQTFKAVKGRAPDRGGEARKVCHTGGPSAAAKACQGQDDGNSARCAIIGKEWKGRGSQAALGCDQGQAQQEATNRGHRSAPEAEQERKGAEGRRDHLVPSHRHPRHTDPDR